MDAKLRDDARKARDSLRAIYNDREAPARTAVQHGQKVIGCISNNVPEELILAAGMLPVQITGDPSESTDVGDRYMEEFNDGNVRSLFDRILRGHFNYLDLIIIPRTSESYLQLYYYLLEARNWEPDLPFPEVYLFDLLQTPFYITGRYVRGRMDALKAKLEALVGSVIQDDAIAHAISVTNANRQALAELNRVRRNDPSALKGSDMLQIISASQFMDKATHTDLVNTILLGLDQSATNRTRPRVMIKGSPHDNSAFYELVEGCGAHIVSDDHVWGERLFEHPIVTHADLMESLTLQYQRFSVSPRSYPQIDQDAIFGRLVEDAEVDAVIFYLDENDDTLGWDYPKQKALLDKLDIPSLYLKFQPYRLPDSAAQVRIVSQFLDQVSTPSTL